MIQILIVLEVLSGLRLIYILTLAHDIDLDCLSVDSLDGLIITTLGFLAAVMHESLMQGALAPLSESLIAPIQGAHEWFLPRVRVIVLDQVLLQGKALSTFAANPLFLNFVDFHMPLQAVFGSKALVTVEHITLKSPIRHICFFDNFS